MGGSELAVLACLYPKRSAGLVLMASAIIDSERDESQLYDELRDKLPDAMVPQKPPPLTGDKSAPVSAVADPKLWGGHKGWRR